MAAVRKSNLLSSILKKFSLWPATSRSMLVVGICLLLAVLLLDIGVHIYGHDPFATSDAALLAPNFSHIMGTDQLGRDVFSRVAYGATYSLTVASLAVGISSIAGSVIGALSGFLGGKTDRILSIVFDALYAFPGLILAILISVMLGATVITTSIAISVGYLPQYFRVVRSLSFSIKERPFVEATRSLGARSRDLILHHVIIYAIPSIIALMTLGVGSAILDVSGLGFLGLGLPPPIPEWGTDLGRGRDFISSGVWWTSAFPGLMILFAVLGFSLMGEGLDEILRGRKEVSAR